MRPGVVRRIEAGRDKSVHLQCLVLYMYARFWTALARELRRMETDIGVSG